MDGLEWFPGVLQHQLGGRRWGATERLSQPMRTPLARHVCVIALYVEYICIAWPVTVLSVYENLYLYTAPGSDGNNWNVKKRLARCGLYYTNKRGRFGSLKNNGTRTRTIWCMMWYCTDMATWPGSLQRKASASGYIIANNYTDRNGSYHTSCDAQLQTRT